MSARVALALAALACSATAGAADLRQIEVTYEDGIYTVESEVWFDVGRAALYDVFSRWDLSAEFSSAIVEARDIIPEDGSGRGFYVRNRGCFLFFCKTVERYGSVTAVPPVELSASADPARSDFEISDEHWTFAAEDGGTVVRYTLRMKPGFWVPPLIGPYVVKRKLRDDGGEALDRIERMARERAADG